jgi:hypothetical protein
MGVAIKKGKENGICHVTQPNHPQEDIMQYKTFGKTGRNASILGFGAMRLPGSGERKVDYDQSVPILRKGIDAGITYIDSW